MVVVTPADLHVYVQGVAAGRTAPGRKVMVVADPTSESAGALQFALTHAVLEQDDELILLHVNTGSLRNAISAFLRRSSIGSSATVPLEGGGGEEMDFLKEMKHACKVAKPKLHVRTVRVDVEGKEKNHIILSQCISQGIDIVFVGQRRSLSTLLGANRYRSTNGTRGIDTIEYLIDNSPCTCVGVQKKGRQNAGYVLNSKTLRNFWLLA
ncbi:hypothetical protein L6164_016425 [Bauhinia variegata]|uniref:Uncharacterized protein n=1 Tax=Bauhinia variegata TaxID=167791 RepID=A0ACB9NQT9_BAUVA|nr:hypothetical protein L6164_016425 [Bauhinia variegata]